MPEPIVIVGTDEIASYLSVGRKQTLEWIEDSSLSFPAVKVGRKGRYMAGSENLKARVKERLFDASK